ncbi:MAG: hypothetical protein F4053_00855 [Proteobacteria bacterium]|nr:hypothetical protein [Pseudomonadota bacterium]
MSAGTLVTEVLESLPQPVGPDVIDDVFCAIEANKRWQAEFDGLAGGYRDGRDGAAKVIAWTVSRQIGLADTHDKRCVSRSGLAKTYTRMRVP